MERVNQAAAPGNSWSSEQMWARHARSFLFVPGTRPERFARARDSGVDAVIIDLEDAVDIDAKTVARANALTWLEADERAIVRVNAPGTPWFKDDLGALCGGHPQVVLVPKVESTQDVTRVGDALPAGSAIIPTLETAAGVHCACDLAQASASVVRIAVGNMDLARDLGIDPGSGPLMDHVGARVAVESRAHGLAAPVAGVTASLTDTTAVARDADHAIGLGFGGKVCIHPAQVKTVTEAFTPSPASIAWAKRVLAASDGGVVTVVDGEMVDQPITDRAAGILHRAGPTAE